MRRSQLKDTQLCGLDLQAELAELAAIHAESIGWVQLGTPEPGTAAGGVGGAGKCFRPEAALLHKPNLRRHAPNPRRIYPTATVTGRSSWLKRLSSAARMCSSTT